MLDSMRSLLSGACRSHELDCRLEGCTQVLTSSTWNGTDTESDFDIVEMY